MQEKKKRSERVGVGPRCTSSTETAPLPLPRTGMRQVFTVEEKEALFWIGYSAVRSVSAECSAIIGPACKSERGKNRDGGRRVTPQREEERGFCPTRTHIPQPMFSWTQTRGVLKPHKRSDFEPTQIERESVFFFCLIRDRALWSSGEMPLCSSSCSPGSAAALGYSGLS